MSPAVTDYVVLFHSVAADSKSADERAGFVKRSAAGEKNDSVLVRVGRLTSLGAGIVGVIYEKIEERTGEGPIDAWRI